MVLKKQIPTFRKNVVINADDFGISIGTNIGIEKSFRRGILSSTSLMPSGFAYEDAIRTSKRNKNLGVGIHLSLTWGKSVLDRKYIPDLVDTENFFYPGVSKTFIKLFLKPQIRIQIKKEFDAQIKKVLKSGIKPDHLNGQEHIHFLPFIFPIVVSLSKKYKINHVRVPLEPLFSVPSFSSFVKWFFLQSMGVVLKLQGNKISGKTKFYGILFTSQMRKGTIEKIILKCKTFPIEVLLHPGVPDLGCDKIIFSKQKVDEFLLSSNRIAEYKTLLNSKLKEYLVRREINIVRFKELN